MAARAIWKGVIRFGAVRVPVKLYSAVQDRGVHFRLLHAADRVPVEQRMVHGGTGDEVPHEQVRKGYEVERGMFVVLEDEDLDTLEPEASREIEVLRFLPRGGISHQWYDRPYWLGPDGDEEAYFALALGLRRSGREGVARWVMRKKDYVGALRAEGEHLILNTLRHAEEVVVADELPAPGGRALDPKELQLAEQLVSALADRFDPKQYHDEYRERVHELVAAKAEGQTVAFEPYEERKRPRSLARALEASLRAAKERARA